MFPIFEYSAGSLDTLPLNTLLQEFKTRFLDKIAEGHTPESALDQILEEDKKLDKGPYGASRRVRLKDIFSFSIQEKVSSSEGSSEGGEASGEGLGSQTVAVASEFGKPGGGGFVSKQDVPQQKNSDLQEGIESDFYKPVPDKEPLVWDDQAIKSRAIRELKRTGYLNQEDKLTSKALQELGQHLLKTIFQDLKAIGFGTHETHKMGIGFIKAHETKPYQEGDPFRVNVGKSLLSGVRRKAQIPIQLKIEDFRIDLLEHQSRTATVLIADRSQSMSYENRMIAVRKTSLALFQLITALYPGDQIWVVGMDTTAELIHPSQLPFLTQERLWTNMEAALNLSRKLLQKYPDHLKQIVMITDGHPTVCTLNEKLYKNPSRPVSDIIAKKTLREVALCTMSGIRLHTIMLTQDKFLSEFANRMAEINRGNVYYVEPDQLAKFLLVSYTKESLSRKVTGNS